MTTNFQTKADIWSINNFLWRVCITIITISYNKFSLNEWGNMHNECNMVMANLIWKSSFLSNLSICNSSHCLLFESFLPPDPTRIFFSLWLIMAVPDMRSEYLTYWKNYAFNQNFIRVKVVLKSNFLYDFLRKCIYKYPNKKVLAQQTLWSPVYGWCSNQISSKFFVNICLVECILRTKF